MKQETARERVCGILVARIAAEIPHTVASEVAYLEQDYGDVAALSITFELSRASIEAVVGSE